MGQLTGTAAHQREVFTLVAQTRKKAGLGSCPRVFLLHRESLGPSKTPIPDHVQGSAADQRATSKNSSSLAEAAGYRIKWSEIINQQTSAYKVLPWPV